MTKKQMEEITEKIIDDITANEKAYKIIRKNHHDAAVLIEIAIKCTCRNFFNYLIETNVHFIKK
jgi:hypothetical protein